MRIGNREYRRSDIEKRTGSVAQLGGVRHYELTEGTSRGVRAADFITGSGFQFTVLRDRAMDISRASYKGTNLAYMACTGEGHPAYYDPAGNEWFRTWFAGLLTTCGLTYFGSPARDGDEALGLHGRVTNLPARQVRDLSRWEGDEYLLELRGTVDEALFYGHKLRMERALRSRIGDRSLTIEDTVTNFGTAPSPFVILYHINPGFPLLDAGSELTLSAKSCEPYNPGSQAGMKDRLRFALPKQGFTEQDFLHTMSAGRDGYACEVFANPKLGDGLALYIRHKTDTLPFLSEWKMLGEQEYIVGLEPCNAKVVSRPELKAAGTLPMLDPGESRTMRLEIGVLDGAKEIAAWQRKIQSL